MRPVCESWRSAKACTRVCCISLWSPRKGCGARSLVDGARRDIVFDMKTISVAVSELDYEAFRQASKAQGRSIAQLIREAMTLYREQQLETRTLMLDLPVLLGHRPIAGAAQPSREALYDEIYAEPVEPSVGEKAETVHEPMARYGDDSA